MDSSGHPSSSAQSSSEQHHLQQQNPQQHNNTLVTSQQEPHPPFRDTTTPSKEDIPLLSNQPQPPSIAINSTKDLSLETPQFTIPHLPNTLSRRGSSSPDIRISPKPANLPFSHPTSYPQDAPTEYKMSHQQQRQPQQDDDGPPPAQRRKLNSPEGQSRSHNRSDEESDSRRGSASKGGAMSYDPVHEYHQQAALHHHSRRPSSANSQRSRISSFSAQSSNPDVEESTSPITGDQSISPDGKKRKHKCPECGQYFTRLHNLKSHLLTHSQEKPFICQECGHKFRRLHDLKRHHKLHTGERPYTCPGCSRSFARMDALNRHRKPGGECSLHNLASGSQQNAVERRMSLPPGVGRPASSQGSTSPLPQTPYNPADFNINPALATASHGHSYPPTHLPPKQKHHYHRDLGDPSPGLLAPPASSTSFGRSPPPPTFGPTGNGRGVQPPPLMIPNSATSGPMLSPIHSHHHSSGTLTGSSSSGGRSAPGDGRPIPPMMDQVAQSYSLTESPRGMTPPPLQHPPLAVPASSLPLLPSPGTLISPSPRNSYDRSPRQSIDGGRSSDGSRGYFDSLVERNRGLEERVKLLEGYVRVLWQDRENSLRRQSTDHSRQSS